MHATQMMCRVDDRNADIIRLESPRCDTRVLSVVPIESNGQTINWRNGRQIDFKRTFRDLCISIDIGQPILWWSVIAMKRQVSSKRFINWFPLKYTGVAISKQLSCFNAFHLWMNALSCFQFRCSKHAYAFDFMAFFFGCDCYISWLMNKNRI